tara:strand:+ start:4103 stop:4339 length:237 start_codon:yes stop_codon:yes gene_type:complete
MSDHDAQIDPVMSPLADFFRSGRTQCIVMHPCPEDSQAAFATQSVISSQHDDGVFANKTIDNQLREQSPEIVDLPRRL